MKTRLWKIGHDYDFTKVFFSSYTMDHGDKVVPREDI